MANQRMFIRCASCGSERMLAKRLLGPYHTIKMAVPWNEWFEEHAWGFCGQGAEGLDIFSLVYEHVDENGDPDGA